MTVREEGTTKGTNDTKREEYLFEGSRFRNEESRKGGKVESTLFLLSWIPYSFSSEFFHFAKVSQKRKNVFGMDEFKG